MLSLQILYKITIFQNLKNLFFMPLMPPQSPPKALKKAPPIVLFLLYIYIEKGIYSIYIPIIFIYIHTLYSLCIEGFVFNSKNALNAPRFLRYIITTMGYISKCQGAFLKFNLNLQHKL